MDQPLKTLEKSSRSRRISRLDNAAGVLSELQRIYRELRLGKLEPYVAARLTAILKETRATIEVSTFEAGSLRSKVRFAAGERPGLKVVRSARKSASRAWRARSMAASGVLRRGPGHPCPAKVSSAVARVAGAQHGKQNRASLRILAGGPAQNR